MQETQDTWIQSLSQEDPPGEGNGNLFQYSCLGNLVDKGAWWGCKRVIQDQAHTHGSSEINKMSLIYLCPISIL